MGRWRSLAIGTALACLSWLGGCGDDGSPAGPGDGGTDSGADADAGSTAPDATTPDGGAEALQGTRLVLVDGRSIEGELIATYDHRAWWTDPSDELTYALFDPARLAEYPDDHSVSLWSSHDVREMTTVLLRSGVRSYQDELRARAIVIAGVPIAGVAYVITGNGGYHVEENGYGDYAWDLVLTDGAGARFRGTGASNEDYLVWDAEVHLPNGGTVIEVVRDVPDNVPGSYVPESPNNMVGVHLFGQFYLYLLHFRQGTIPAAVAPGAVLEAGTVIGRVGNAGVSLEPHLHMTVLWFDADGVAPRTWSVPSELAGIYATGSQALAATRHDHFVPTSGTWISEAPF